MVIVLALSAWMNNIIAAVVAFIYSSVIGGAIVTLHRAADQGAMGNINDAVRLILDVLYWFVPHPLGSSLASDLHRAQDPLYGPLYSDPYAGVLTPHASEVGDIAWWALTMVFFGGLLYLALRRRQV